MNKTAIKNFAIWARKKLIADIKYKAGLMGITEKGIASALPQSTDGTEFYDIGTSEPFAISGESIKQRKHLVKLIGEKEKETDYVTAYDYVVEEVAYTWFNRLIAIRFMEVNDYLPSHMRILSSESGKTEPDIVTYPFDTNLDFTGEEEQRIIQLKQNNEVDQLFQMLFIKQCNSLSEILPELFEKTSDYTELLLNISYIDQDGVVWHLLHDIDEGDFDVEKEGQVEILGWLYQYYISEKHDQIINIYKGTVKKEDIPAATQLFTTDWVVRYMVDNSLGRYWIERNPQSNLANKLDFFVTPKSGKIEYIDEKVDPQDLTFFDPCMGSGHILVYAFDVLMEIYRECGYSDRDAALNIVQYNLYGMDIDNRAYQLAYFAVMMKARSYNRRALTQEIYNNLAVCEESNSIDKFACDGITNDKELNKIGEYLIEVYKDAKEIGTLQTVKHKDYNSFTEYLLNIKNTTGQFNLFSLSWMNDILPKMLQFTKQAYIMSKKYTVVCTNPPYLNRLEGVLKEFIIKNYKSYSGDLFSVFMYRSFDYCKSDGYTAFMTPFVWMFIKTYEPLRKYVIENKSVTTLVQMEYSAFDEATVPICSFVFGNKRMSRDGLYIKLSDFKGGMDVQRRKVLEALADKGCKYFYETSMKNFYDIDGVPFAFWASNGIREAFKKCDNISKIAPPKQGLATADNERFLKRWYEVELNNIGFGYSNCEEAFKSKKKWFPYNKGGAFRRWYGNREYVVNWENDGFEIKNFRDDNGKVRSRPQNLQYYFKPCITWSDITSASFSGRYSEKGFIFDIKGSSGFPDEKILPYVLGFLNSSVSQKCIKILNPTITTQVGDMARIPVIVDEKTKPAIIGIVSSCISISKSDWDFFETSWDFSEHPLVMLVKSLRDVTNVDTSMVYYNGNNTKVRCTLEICYTLWKIECNKRFKQLKDNEEELNRIFIDLYGLQEELTPNVEDKDVTVRRAELSRDIKSLISYSVGCMFGRYSLDTTGLVYAGGEWNEKNYCEFVPDVDNCIPITDEEYFEDDIVGLFCKWLKKVFGEDTFEENLDYIAKALGNKGNTSREVIRNYFLNDFIKDHNKIYQKHPIYWLFDSGKQNGFKALMYLHRYTPDTIGNLRVDYLHRMQRVYESEMNRMQDMIEHSTNSREVAAASKRKEKLQKQLKECREYDEKISHLALDRIELDLDDGVKYNYRKIQTGRDRKFYEVLADSKSIMMDAKKYADFKK